MNIKIKNSLQEFIDVIEPKIKAIDGPDYYVGQSAIKMNPELLILGINPAGTQKLSQSAWPSKKPENLVYDSNQYLKNPAWPISRKLNTILSGNVLRPIYENAVIMNFIPLNTPNEGILKNSEYKNIVKDCKMFSENFIYNILQPKRILILGPSLSKMMNIKFDHIADSVLRTEDDKNYLVVKFMRNNIPHYVIHHPSRASFNGNNHLEKKRDYFENEFKD